MRNWDSSGRIKIERAYAHIDHFETEVVAYTRRRPYIVTPQVNDYSDEPGVQRMGHEFVVTEREAVDIRWSAVVADAVHNLHTALDHLWQRVTTKTGRRKNYFPAYESPEAAEAFLNRKEKGRRHPAVDVLDGINAFQVGNPFWLIRQFDDTDKHDSLRLVASYPGALVVTLNDNPKSPMIPTDWRYVPVTEPERRRVGFPPLENGAIVYGSPYVPNLDVKIDVTPVIAFGEGGILEGEAVWPILKELAKAVDILAAGFLGKGLLK